ncbi:MAG: outer membrane protein [Xanthobacteraceae bacterium]
MRRLIIALGLIAASGAASAQEFELPTLRGSEPFVPAASVGCSCWDGFYAGAQVGYGFGSMDFATSTRSLVSHMLRELALEAEQFPSTWEVLGKVDTHGASAGGFFGYNIGWESVILGFELNYSRLKIGADAPQLPIERVAVAGGNVYDVTINGAASMRMSDLLTLRARAGYEVYNFLPYVMIGVAAARADLAHSATVSGQQNPPPPTVPVTPCGPPASPNCVPFSFSESESKNGAFLYGWALGGGFEVLVMPHVFLRAEYEYVAFVPTWGIKPSLMTGRAGVGFKF